MLPNKDYQMIIEWVETKELRRKAVDFLSATITTDTAYISHGEIQTGLSEDGKVWAPTAPNLMLADMAERDHNTSVVLAHENDVIVGTAIVVWTQTPHVSFGVIEDVAVAHSHRSKGLGTEILEFIISDAKLRQMNWMFLESGLDNHRAHAFFERHGFNTVSHVFAKRF